MSTFKGGFQTSNKSRAARARIIFGSKNTALPVPNVYYPADKSYLHPVIEDYDGETNPDGDFELAGYIQEIEFVEVPSYQNRQDKSKDKDGLVFNLTFTTYVDGRDYAFSADLGDMKLNQLNGTALNMVSQFSALAEKVKADPSLRNQFYQLSAYLGKPSANNGLRYSQTVIREPISYQYQKNADGTDNEEALPIPIYDFNTRIKADLPPRPEEVYVEELKQTVRKTAHIKEWLHEKKALIESVFGPNADIEHDSHEQADADLANELDEVQTADLGSDLASPTP